MGLAVERARDWSFCAEQAGGVSDLNVLHIFPVSMIFNLNCVHLLQLSSLETLIPCQSGKNRD